MDQQELQQNLMEFEKNRNQLMNIGAQKQQLQMQSAAVDAALDELNKTSEKKAYKAVGNILVLCDVIDLKKELSEQKESTDLRIKTVQKQEDNMIEKLNKLRSKIEAVAAEMQGKAPSASIGESTKVLPSKEKGKK